MSICPRCAGVGAVECSRCGKLGEIYQFQPVGFGIPDCPKCKGFGYIDCVNCAGSGEIEDPFELDCEREVIYDAQLPKQ